MHFGAIILVPVCTTDRVNRADEDATLYAILATHMAQIDLLQHIQFVNQAFTFTAFLNYDRHFDPEFFKVAGGGVEGQRAESVEERGISRRRGGMGTKRSEAQKRPWSLAAVLVPGMHIADGAFE